MSLGVVKLNKELYSSEAIAEALADWGEVGTFSVEDGEAYHEVHLEALADGEETPETLQEVLGELQNYILGIEIGRRH